MKNVVLENFRDNMGNFPTDIICNDCHKQSEVYVEIQLDNGSPLIRLCKTCISKYEQDINRTIINECKKGVRNE